MIKLRALKPLYGKYCRDHNPIQAGDIFQVNEADAESLEARGLAERYFESKMAPAPQNKMLSPAENKDQFPIKRRA